MIRNVKLTDFDGVLALSRSMYKEAETNSDFGDYLFLKRPTRVKMDEWFAKVYDEAKNGHSIYLVAEENGAIVGHCFIRKRDIPDSERSHTGALSILVNKEWRNRGIGTMLIKKALRLSRKKFDIIQLSVLTNNPKAISLYKRLGFRKWGIEPMYAKRDGKYIDSVHMYLRLK